MKISASFSKKIPGKEEYSSLGSHLQIEVEPPPEIQEDREKLRRYVHALFQECRERVEEELAHDQEPSRSNGHATRPPHRRRQFVAPRRIAGTNGRDGQTSNGNASPKQVNYLRSLANEAGIGYGGLRDLATECFGKADLRTLTKREASRLIDDLRVNESE